LRSKVWSDPFFSPLLLSFSQSTFHSLIFYIYFISDHTGVTPLIEAVKNGHLEVVRALLDKGENFA